MTNNTEWRWPNFTPDELRCKETGELSMVPDFMDKLQALRTDFGKPMIVSSGYRSMAHSIEARKEHYGAHVLGRAVDIRVSHNNTFELLQAVVLFNAAEAGLIKHEDIRPWIEAMVGKGFTGIGVNQKGGSRFIHLDDAPAAEWRPRPHLWSY